jgi:hypothetical protein
MSLGVIIRLSSFDEDPSRALDSVLDNLEHISDVTVVYPAYKNDMKIPWSAKKNAIIEAGKAFAITPTPSHINDAAIAIVEIPPYCSVGKGAFEMIKTQLKRSDKTNFAISTITVLPNLSPFYGFLIVSIVLDWLWSRIIHRDKLYQTNDIRVRCVMQRAGRKYVAPDEHWVWRYIWNDSCAPKLYGGDMAIMRPPYARSGWGYVHWTLHFHRNYKWGTWLFVFAVPYSIIALCVVALVYSTAGVSWFVVSNFGVILLMAFTISGHYLETPARRIMCILTPLYLVFFPLAIVYAKVMAENRTWK